ncbi:vWA domain-containing protein [Hyphomicrobium sp. DY-1]|uniref:vWA domain-containing protein n=1 Tax=Hyphomicrobium sp. DY-1 TaxID=3075650 RepID=UPI0039C312FD
MKCALVWRSALNSRRSVWAVLASKKRWAALGSDERGSVAIIFGLTIFVLFAMVGLAVDYARFVNARSQTIAATDAAVLAGARALQSNGGDQEDAERVAMTYYQQATLNRIHLLSDSIHFDAVDSGTAMEADGNAVISTPFMHLAFGLAGTQSSTLPLLRADGSDYSKAVLAVGGNGEQSLEVSLMLDITGSMAGQKLTDLKSAASDLINIVVWQDQSKYTSKIAIVPFAEDVRLPSDKFKLVTGYTKKTSSPCVVERMGQQTATDAAPGSNAYITVHNKNDKKSVTPYCDLDDDEDELLPLTSNKSALLDKISGLSTKGGTAGHIGTAWAWYMLSPNWASVWGSSAPAAYGTEKLKKIAVLMTDGDYNTQYDSYGYSVDYGQTPPRYSCKDAEEGCSSVQASSLCTAIKAKGIEVYTVGFQIGTGTLADTTLKNCATDTNHYYNSSTGDALKAAFRDIALKISTLYLSQ